jgi:hypothetical protein
MNAELMQQFSILLSLEGHSSGCVSVNCDRMSQGATSFHGKESVGLSQGWNRLLLDQIREMGRASMPVIHEVLPTEVLATIFEEHAKCEWHAPAIDARVCRVWRKIVLNTPRAWGSLEILHHQPKGPSIRQLQPWLDRSGAVPLNIRVGIDIEFENGAKGRALYNLLSEYHMRIGSLRMASSSQYLFKGREFPCLRLLDIQDWYLLQGDSSTIHFCSLPKLRSLRLGINPFSVEDPKDTMVPLNDLPSMESLALSHTTCTSLVQHSQSLTTLMLDAISFEDPISRPVDFPSLTYLSLYDVLGLKPHIKAPYLVTYHEGGGTIYESFSTSLPSLVEYGLYYPNSSDSDLTKWHVSFPNMSRVAIRAVPRILIPLLDSLSAHLCSLLVLRTISVGSGRGDVQFTEDQQKTMKSLIGVQSDACHMDVALCFEEARPFRIPIFFGAVSHRTNK